jgi:hypothetical protein
VEEDVGGEDRWCNHMSDIDPKADPWNGLYQRLPVGKRFVYLGVEFVVIAHTKSQLVLLLFYSFMISPSITTEYVDRMGVIQEKVFKDPYHPALNQ